MSIAQVLVVERDSAVQEFLTETLTNHGYRVHVTGCTERALELVERSHYAAAVIGEQLPNSDGVELYRKIKKRRKGLEGILVTVDGTLDRLRMAIDAGLWDVLSKPPCVPRLILRLDEAAEATA